MATINGVEVIGDKSAHDFDLLDKNDGINLANGVERNRKATEDNHEDIVLHRTDADVHVTPEWKNSLVTKAILGLYWTAAQTADIINEISIAGGAKLVKVDTLPVVGLEQTIYLVPKQDPQAGDVFDEYVWVDGKYEFIGTTKANLSNYYTKVEIDYIVSQLDYKYVKSDDTTIVKLTNLNEINLQEDHYNAWFGYRGGKVTNWKFGDGTEGGLANVWANDYYLNGEKLSDKLEAKAEDSDVIHNSGDETVAGSKNFSEGVRVVGTQWVSTTNTSEDITAFPSQRFYFQRFSSGKLSDLSSGAWDVSSLGAIALMSRVNTDWDIRFKHIAGGSGADIYKFAILDKDGQYQQGNFHPKTNNTYSLGTFENKWADVQTEKINGETVVTPTYLENKAEEWEFTLSDGSTVTKKIVMA